MPLFFFFGTFQALTILTISHLIMKFQVDLRSALQKSFSKDIDSSGLIYFFFFLLFYTLDKNTSEGDVFY